MEAVERTRRKPTQFRLINLRQTAAHLVASQIHMIAARQHDSQAHPPVPRQAAIGSAGKAPLQQFNGAGEVRRIATGDFNLARAARAPRSAG